MSDQKTACPKCGSTLGFDRDGARESSTLMGYSSPPGHNHDDNCRKRRYTCKGCGKSVILSKRNTCHACDWKGKKTCFCHEGQKVDQWPNELRDSDAP